MCVWHEVFCWIRSYHNLGLISAEIKEVVLQSVANVLICLEVQTLSLSVC